MQERAKQSNLIEGATGPWEVVGRVHGEVFGGIRPAASILEVSSFINPGWLVEIEADAIIQSAGG